MHLFQYIIFRYIKLVIIFLKKIFLIKSTNWKIRIYYMPFHVTYLKSIINKAIPQITIDKNNNNFFADPFLFEYSKKTFLFVEEFCSIKKKGFISAFRIQRKKALYIGKALEEDFHLSFPNLFYHNKEIYMVPETSETSQIRLYKCTKFPLEWRLEEILLKGKSCVDPLLFKKDGIWFLFVNEDPLDNGDYAELNIYYSNKLLKGKWVPHSDNPITANSEFSRNGGFCIENNEIYRICQKQTSYEYGQGIKISKVKVLNKNEYIEEKEFEILPQNLKVYGLHHLSKLGNLLAIDVR